MGVESNLTGVPDFDQFEIVKYGTTILPGHSLVTGASTWSVSSGMEVTIAHNLGYVPMVFAYSKFPLYSRSVLLPLSDWLAYSASGLLQMRVASTSDTTNTYFSSIIWGYNQSSSMPDLTIIYYLARQKAKTT